MTSWLKRKEIRSAYSWFCVMHGHQPEVNVAAPTDSDSAGGFPGGSDGKEYACNVGGLGSIPGSGRCPGEENGYPLQYSGLENSMD